MWQPYNTDAELRKICRTSPLLFDWKLNPWD